MGEHETRDLDVTSARTGKLFLKLRQMTWRVLTFGSELASPLLAGRSLERN